MCKAPMAPPVETKKPPRRAQHILRYASCRDVAMYAAAFVTVMVSGLNQPAQLIIFGNLLDSFNRPTRPRPSSSTSTGSCAVVGIQHSSRSRSRPRWRRASPGTGGAAMAVAAVLSRPISWTDQKTRARRRRCSNPARHPDGLGELTTALQGVFAFVFGLAVSLYQVVAGVGRWRAAVLVVLLGLASRSRAGRTPRPPAWRPRRPSRTRRSSTWDRGRVRRRAPGDEPPRGGVRARGGRHPRPPCRRTRTRRSSRASSTAPGPPGREMGLPHPPGHEAPRLLQLRAASGDLPSRTTSVFRAAT